MRWKTVRSGRLQFSSIISHLAIVYKETKLFKIAVFELNRTIWPVCFEFLWFFSSMGIFFVTSFMLLRWNIKNIKNVVQGLLMILYHRSSHTPISCQYPLINHLALCIKYFPEFSGSQQKLSTYFNKTKPEKRKLESDPYPVPNTGKKKVVVAQQKNISSFFIKK